MNTAAPASGRQPTPPSPEIETTIFMRFVTSMLSTKRSASDMMVCSPQRFPLLMDNRLGQGQCGERVRGQQNGENWSLKEKIYNNSKLEAQSRGGVAMLRARLKRRSNVLGLRDENGASGSSDGGDGTRVHGSAATFKKVRHENSKDTIKFSQSTWIY